MFYLCSISRQEEHNRESEIFESRILWLCLYGILWSIQKTFPRDFLPTSTENRNIIHYCRNSCWQFFSIKWFYLSLLQAPITPIHMLDFKNKMFYSHLACKKVVHTMQSNCEKEKCYFQQFEWDWPGYSKNSNWQTSKTHRDNSLFHQKLLWTARLN